MILKHKNYQNNRLYEKTLPEGMLNGQGIAPLNRYRYGLFSFSWCGCEIIAVYNLLKMHGKPQKLQKNGGSFAVFAVADLPWVLYDIAVLRRIPQYRLK